MHNKWQHSIVLSSVICGTLLAMPVKAANPAEFDPAGYIGAGYGRIDVDESDFEDKDDTKKGYLGVKFNKYVGIEGSVNDFGETSRGAFHWDLEGQTLALIGFLPFNERFELFAKAGNLWWDADVEVAGIFDDDLDGNETLYGAGAQFNFNDKLSMRAEYERYKIDLEEDEIGVDVDRKSDVNVASLGVQYNF